MLETILEKNTKSLEDEEECIQHIYKSTHICGSSSYDEKSEVISQIRNFKLQECDSYRVRLYQSASYEDRLTAVDLAGREIVTNDICGTYSTSYMCDCHKTTVIKKMNCNNLYCPVCFRGAAYKRANVISNRLMSVSNYLQELGFNKDSIHCNHIIVSFAYEGTSAVITKKVKGKDKDIWYDLSDFKGYQKLKSRTIEILRASGIIGGVLIYHPYRLSKTSPKKLIFGPHFHLMAFGHLISSTKFYSRYSVVYKNKGHRNNHESLTKTIGYQLTHCGRYKGHQSTSWFGECSYNKLVHVKDDKDKPVIVRKIEFSELCEHCESRLYKVINKVNVYGDKNLSSKSKTDQWVSGNFVLKGKNVVINNNARIEYIGKIVVDRNNWLTKKYLIYKLKYHKYVYKPRDKPIPTGVGVNWFKNMFTP